MRCAAPRCCLFLSLPLYLSRPQLRHSHASVSSTCAFSFLLLLLFSIVPSASFSPFSLDPSSNLFRSFLSCSNHSHCIAFRSCCIESVKLSFAGPSSSLLPAFIGLSTLALLNGSNRLRWSQSVQAFVNSSNNTIILLSRSDPSVDATILALRLVLKAAFC